MWALNVDINLLNRHCKPADWPAAWLLDLLRHFGTQGTQALVRQSPLEGHLGTRAFKALGHLRHSSTRRALGHTSTQSFWALGHSGTWALGQSKGTRALQGLRALYLADSFFFNLNNQMHSRKSLWRCFSRIWYSLTFKSFLFTVEVEYKYEVVLYNNSTFKFPGSCVFKSRFSGP